jgi:tRNA(Ile)-lysidine synthase TilS/MesJ
LIIISSIRGNLTPIYYQGWCFGLKKMLGYLRRGVTDFDMIQDGDKIAVGLSGGKDSNTLLYAMKLYQGFSPHKFDLKAITISLGLPGFDTEALRQFCRSIGVELTIVDTYIGHLLFDVRREKNPCSLCANMRRGALNNAALRIGCSKVALAHHKNDAVETLLLSMFYESRISTFSPVTYLSRKGITLIRPMIYAPESEIRTAVKKNSIPVIHNPCPADGKTRRQFVKDLLRQLGRDIPDIENHIFKSILNSEQVNLWDIKAAHASNNQPNLT